MRFLFLSLLFLAQAWADGNGTYGLITNLRRQSWVPNYPEGSSQGSPLPYASNSSAWLVNGLYNNVQHYYNGQIYVGDGPNGWTYDDQFYLSQGSASAYNWYWDRSYRYAEMVIYNGHGNYDRLAFPDANVYITNNGGNARRFGREWTRYLIFMGCKTLAVPKPGDYTVLFDGLHALFGYASLSFEFYAQNPRYPYDPPYRYSGDLGKIFSSLYVAGQVMIYGAWELANKTVFYEYGVTPGIEPAHVCEQITIPRLGYNFIPYRYDNYHGCSEQIHRTYNASMLPNTNIPGAPITTGPMYARSRVYGYPRY